MKYVQGCSDRCQACRKRYRTPSDLNFITLCGEAWKPHAWPSYHPWYDALPEHADLHTFCSHLPILQMHYTCNITKGACFFGFAQHDTCSSSKCAGACAEHCWEDGQCVQSETAELAELHDFAQLVRLQTCLIALQGESTCTICT